MRETAENRNVGVMSENSSIVFDFNKTLRAVCRWQVPDKQLSHRGRKSGHAAAISCEMIFAHLKWHVSCAD